MREEERIAHLEAEIAALRAEVQALRQQLAQMMARQHEQKHLRRQR